MQNSDMSLAPIPESKSKEPAIETARHVTDKNRVDPIARSSEPGRHGDDSVYIPPSHLHPERSTVQSALDNSLTASTGGSYGLDHFLDKGSVGESAAEPPMEKQSDLGKKVKTQVSHAAHRVSDRVKGGTQQVDGSIHRQPILYALGAMGAGLLIGRFLKFSTR